MAVEGTDTAGGIDMKGKDFVVCRVETLVDVLIHALVQAGVDDDDVIVDAIIAALSDDLGDH